MKIGPLSRGGRSRNRIQALDHDFQPEAVLVPLGILEIARGDQALSQLKVLFGQSRETSDFLVDGLEHWWQHRAVAHPGVQKLQILLDNGPEVSRSRTQFLKRLVDFVDASRREIELVYDPPYHSKYNPVERSWGVLEEHWNGALLDSIETALNWAKTMTWHHIHPIVEFLEQSYEAGVTIAKKLFSGIAARLDRHPTLPKWSLFIRPT